MMGKEKRLTQRRKGAKDAKKKSTLHYQKAAMDEGYIAKQTQ
jgi:hypothetical protein